MKALTFNDMINLDPEPKHANNIHRLLAKYLKKRGLRKKSKQTYESKFKTFCEYLSSLHIYRVERVSYSIVEDFFETLDNNSATTYNSYICTLHSFFEDFLNDKLIHKNPFSGIRKKAETRQGKMFFSARHVEQLSQIIKEENPSLWIACQLLYYCFIRNTEIANLPMEDVFAGEGTIRLHSLYSKNKKTQTVVVPDEFLPLFRAWYSQQKEVGAQYFITVNKEKVSSGAWFYRQHDKILKRLGYSSRFSFYSWKHTGAVHFYRETKDLKSLQLQLRHHSLDQVDEYMRELGVMENIGIKVHRLPVIVNPIPQQAITI